MRLEMIPQILGVLVGLAGLLVLYQVISPPAIRLKFERRRKPRPVASAAAQACFAMALVLLAVALITPDEWKYKTVAMMASTGYIIVAIFLARSYLLAYLLNRGADRRRDESEQATPLRELRRRWPKTPAVILGSILPGVGSQASPGFKEDPDFPSVEMPSSDKTPGVAGLVDQTPVSEVPVEDVRDEWMRTIELPPLDWLSMEESSGEGPKEP